jgi:hypothetical protein
MRHAPILLSASLMFALGSAPAWAQSAYPIADKVAAKVVQKYQTTSCQDLAKERQTPKSAEKAQVEQRAGQMLRQDPQLRASFVSKVAAPVVDKMIVCGFIP